MSKRELADYGVGEEVLRLGFWSMLVADGRHNANFPYAPEHVGSNVRTARVVTEIFRE